MNRKIAIIVSEFNDEVTSGLLLGATRFLNEVGIKKSNIKIIKAPGAFEIPLLAKVLAKSNKYYGVICLGAVIKGGTAHFEFISLGATMGIMNAMLETEVPISFGILTTYNEKQAKHRSEIKGKRTSENKGREAAAACYKMIMALRELNPESPARL